MARLPQPGSDVGTWGDVLNDYLSQTHNTDGTLKDNSVTSAALAPGAVTVTEIANSTITEAKLDSAVQTKLNSGGGGGVTSVNTRTGAVTLTKTDVGLASVDNTSDDNKPVSAATQTALNAKADTSSLAPVATSGSYDDLSDKPVIPGGTVADSSVTPAKLASDTPVGGELLSYNGTGFEWISAPAAGGGGETNTASNIGTGGVGVYKQKSGVNFELKSVRAGSNKLTVTDNTGNNTLDLDVVPANLGLTKASVGLPNVDNTSDANKPVSTAAQTALDLKANTSHTHAATDLTSGTVATARLGSGTASTSTYLRGDNTWATPAGGGWTAVDASETVKGIAEIATEAETTTGTDDTRMVTPLKLKTQLDSKMSTGIAGLPAGVTLTAQKASGVWPARPTSRGDIVVIWKGPDPSPAIVSSGTGGMHDNVDIRMVTM